MFYKCSKLVLTKILPDELKEGHLENRLKEEYKHIMLPAKDFCCSRYPKKYNVSRTVDPDLCQKAFNKQRDFTFGIFSAGLNYLY